MTEGKRILVIGPAWVGDMVMAQSLFMTLKGRNPDCVIDVVAPAWSRALLARMPQVHQSFELAVGHKQLGLGARMRLARQLRQQHYDQAVVLPRSLKAALVPALARIPKRTGYRGEMRYGLINDMRELDKSVLTQTVQRFVALGRPANATLPPRICTPRLQVDKDNQQRLLQALGLNLDKPVAGMMPGAEYGPAKQWPVERYRELAVRLTDEGYQVWLFGSPKEQALCNEIAVNPCIINLAGKTRLEDTVDLIALCEVAVTNDSGLMHIASATDTAVVAIYGSSSPSYTPPLSMHATVLYKQLECSPCFDRQCRFGHTNCLKAIETDYVMEHVHTAVE